MWIAKLSILAATLMMSQAAFAQHDRVHGDGCLMQEDIVTDHMLLSSGTCKVVEPLELSSNDAGGSWSARIERVAIVKWGGLRRLTDMCATNYKGRSTPQPMAQNIITGTKKVVVVSNDYDYNPNLEPGARSYELYPIARSDAEANLRKMIRDCNAISDQDIRDRLHIY